MTSFHEGDGTVRLRNLLAACRSVIKQTLDDARSLEDVSLHLVPRFDALARLGAGTLSGGPTEVEDIVRDQLLNVQESDGARTRIVGPPVGLTIRQAPLMSLALHELVTNAVKFGALSHDDAKLAVEWDLVDGRRDVLRLLWTETGVPIVMSAPPREGFGRRFILHGLPYQLEAETSFQLRPGGITCEILLPGVQPLEPSRPLETPTTEDFAS